MFIILWNHWTFRASLLLTGAYLPFQLLAVFVSAAVSELLVARELLAERSRAEERVRIARDLHDVLGHHLVALSLQLELVAKTPAAEAAEHLALAQSLASRLLDDIRAAVYAMKRETNLVDAVQTIAAQTARPSIHVETRGAVEHPEPAVAETLVRCVQEIVTNAAKHSRAEHLWLTLQRSSGRIELRAVDDGGGADRIAAGGGIDGMNERLRLVGGGIDVRNQAGRGLAVLIWVPV
jgi:signal transduction histidine kinase